MKLTVVYDNRTVVEGLETGWGFSCIIEADEKKILFDTGWRGSILAGNMSTLGFDLKDVDIVVLSHQHWDHIGGLPCVMNQGQGFKVYLLENFSQHMKDEIKKEYPVLEVSKVGRITENIYTTGPLGNPIKEQSLAVKTSKGFIIVTGCAHPGLDIIVDRISNYGRVAGLIGGFHGFRYFKALHGLKLMVPCHCTQYRKELKEEFQGKVVYGGAGYTLKI